jgi:glucose-1-phosphate adenylyltransferase
LKKEMIAMLLAGGQGSRLYVLTANVAKPAVPFGGKYRIIDFPLSNCTNSGIDTVGVLTQYQPMELNAYIGSGQPWDLDRVNGGVHVLPPYMRGKGGQWYKGTANAIYQNIRFIDSYDPEYVLILGGDHIYKMDYSSMLAEHKANNSDCTVAVLDVSLKDASRFGILNTREDGTIYEFEEKPKKPKSTLASMGIYIFSWKTLRSYLIADEENPTSQNDFGKNIIPAMLEKGERMTVYRFNGYWKDVGTIDSLWDANMDMLATTNLINTHDSAWKVYARTNMSAPHFIGPEGEVSHSMITEGCEVYGKVLHSVLFSDVFVGENAVVRYSILMPGARVEAGAVVEYAILAENSHVKKGAKVGGDPSSAIDVSKWGIAVLGEGVEIADSQMIPANAMVDKAAGVAL